MKKHLLFFTLTALTIYLTVGVLQPAGAVTELSRGNGTHFCGVSDYHPLWRHHSKRRDHRNYARPFAANLNVGQPRTVRLIYFLPNDRPYQAEVVQRMKDEIRTAQTFFAEQMEAHGYGRRTFRIETDSQGEPMVHRVNGKHPDSYYLDDAFTVEDEIEKMFDFYSNIYFMVVDNSIGGVCSSDGCWGGWGGRSGKQGGAMLVSGSFDWIIVAHELGHTFGLGHDFHDGRYIMSYGPGREDRLSGCHAENLLVHPYFNANIPIEEGDLPVVELISSHIYPSDSKNVSIRVRVSDPDGLHQVTLHAIQPDNRSTVKQCRGLEGRNKRVIEFDYDGVIPSAHDPAYSRSTSLLSPLVHEILIEALDAKGDAGGNFFALYSDDLQPLLKISGDNQHGLPNTPLPVPFVVELRDLNDGSPLFEVPISFTVTAGGGSLSVRHTETDWNGRAESVLTLGPNLGTNTVEVSAEGLTVTFNAVAGAPVEIPDPNLRAAIEVELRVPPNTPIAPADMASLIQLNAYAHAEAGIISNLTGLAHATNLEFLDLGENSVSDFSPLAGLTRLELLVVGRNPKLSDLSPVAGLTNLTYLALWENSISDISALVNLTNLESLQLSFTSISDISVLVGLTHLRWLTLERNAITDISALAGLTNLIELHLAGNHITDISALLNLTHLENLSLNNNAVSDISAVASLTNLTRLVLYQ